MVVGRWNARARGSETGNQIAVSRACQGPSEQRPSNDRGMFCTLLTIAAYLSTNLAAIVADSIQWI